MPTDLVMPMQVARNGIEFLRRVDLKGAEVQPFMEFIAFIELWANPQSPSSSEETNQ